MSPSPIQNHDDKIQVHYRQQLSVLIDGELSADEARFLLRRLQHDEELAGCHERWQLCGDVLRGMAAAPAPLDFAARVRAAVADEPGPAKPSTARPAWRWGGGAIAASVALVALFMARERTPLQPPADAPAPLVASSAQRPATPVPVPAPAPVPDPADPDADAAGAAVAAVPAAALASARRLEAGRALASATRTQQAARSAASRRPSPAVARVAAATPSTALAVAAEAHAVGANPFVPAETLQARPWPRSVLPASGSALNARLEEGGSANFYPFEPRLAVPAELERVPPP